MRAAKASASRRRWAALARARSQVSRSPVAGGRQRCAAPDCAGLRGQGLLRRPRFRMPTAALSWPSSRACAAAPGTSSRSTCTGPIWPRPRSRWRPSSSRLTRDSRGAGGARGRGLAGPGRARSPRGGRSARSGGPSGTASRVLPRAPAGSSAESGQHRHHQFMRMARRGARPASRSFRTQRSGLGFMAASLRASLAAGRRGAHEFQHSVYTRNAELLDAKLRHCERRTVPRAAPGLGVAPNAGGVRLPGAHRDLTNPREKSCCT